MSKISLSSTLYTYSLLACVSSQSGSLSTLFKYCSISWADVLKKGVQKTCFSARKSWLSIWTYR